MISPFRSKAKIASSEDSTRAARRARASWPFLRSVTSWMVERLISKRPEASLTAVAFIRTDRIEPSLRTMSKSRSRIAPFSFRVANWAAKASRVSGVRSSENFLLPTSSSRA